MNLIVVRNKETLQKMSGSRVGAAKMLENANAAIVVIADESKTDVWVEDCSIAMSNMHLAASTLGIGWSGSGRRRVHRQTEFWMVTLE